MKLSKGGRESTAAALRSVMCGAAVPETLARKWNGGKGMCPFCGLEEETLLHRFWRCPKWEVMRQRALGGCSEAWVRSILPAEVLLFGWLLAAENGPLTREGGDPAADFSDRRELPAQVWTDGSALCPADPALRAAAWAGGKEGAGTAAQGHASAHIPLEGLSSVR